jgi:hypothetical protein
MKNFKKKLYAIGWLILLIMICSCRRFDVETWPCDCSVVDEEVQSFVEGAPPGFNNYKPLEIHLVSYIGKVNGNRIAGITKHSKKLILLDTTQRKWREDREAMVWHELGHYVLGRGHNENEAMIGEFFIPESVMSNDYIFLDQKPAYIKEYYLEELWNN